MPRRKTYLQLALAASDLRSIMANTDTDSAWECGPLTDRLAVLVAELQRLADEARAVDEDLDAAYEKGAA